MVHMVHVVHICHFLSRCRGHYPCQYPLSLKDTSQRTHHSVCCISFMALCVFRLEYDSCFKPTVLSYCLHRGLYFFGGAHDSKDQTQHESIYVIECLFLPMSFMSFFVFMIIHLPTFRQRPAAQQKREAGQSGPIALYWFRARTTLSRRCGL